MFGRCWKGSLVDGLCLAHFIYPEECWVEAIILSQQITTSPNIFTSRIQIKINVHIIHHIIIHSPPKSFSC
jgi:hypothetical protein